jgi:collagenase-like PrtC family protease
MADSSTKTEPIAARFEVPLNWSPSFLRFVLDQKHHISTVYGSIVGEPGGRPIPHSGDLSADQNPDAKSLELFVGELRDAGISFNLAMNASCYGNRLFGDDGKAWVIEQVNQIRRLGIDWVTITSFDLARRISALAPDVKILISVMHNMTEIDAIAYTIKQDFNFAGLVIGKGITKQIPRLQRVLAYLRSQKIKAVVMANDFCPTSNCPERMSDHNNACAHYHDNPEDYVSPSIHCRNMSMMEPAHFLQAPVINPFDIPFYESLGVKHFKLTDRVMPDRTLIQVCRAYFERRYNGNLFDLFTYTSYLGDAPAVPRHLTDDQIEEIYLGGYSAFKSARTHFVCQPVVEAKALSGPGSFFEFFEAGHCTMQCGSRTQEIPGCYYCEDKASELLRYDKAEWKAVQSNIERFIKISHLRKEDIRASRFQQRASSDFDEVNSDETDKGLAKHFLPLFPSPSP